MFPIVKKFKLTYINYELVKKSVHYYKVSFPKHQIQALSIASFISTLNDIFTSHATSSQDYGYYIQPTEPDLLQQADTLFMQGKYMDVYELLNKSRFCSNAEVLWRMSRALYAMSHKESINNIQNEMITEAYQLIKVAITNRYVNANVHKWMAILIDHATGSVSTWSRIKAMPEVKKHLLHAIELNPTDVTTLYMLGRWCYQLTSLTWFQRKLASILFISLPESSYLEAYNYFLRAEKLRPRFFIGNTYMLGKISLDMKHFYRAKYYLDVAASLPCRTEFEKKFAQKARQLSHDLHHYDLTKAALLYDTK